MVVDRGRVFDGVAVGRPATGALIDAGFEAISDLPEDLDELLALHGVGPKAVRLLDEARSGRPGTSWIGKIRRAGPPGATVKVLERDA